MTTSTKRRNRGSGYIRKRGETHTAIWHVLDGEGKRHQKSKAGFRTKTEAQQFLNEVLVGVADGTFVDSSKTTVAKFLRSEWIPQLTQRPSTRVSYEHVCERWIIPHIGGIRLQKLSVQDVREMLATLRTKGKFDGEALSARSTTYALKVLRAAMKHAMEHGLVARNVALLVKPPKNERRAMTVWTAEEAKTFLSAVQNDRLYLLWLLALARGFRRGELLGLRWEDIDFDNGRVSVVRTIVLVNGKPTESQPKTDGSRRSVPLDADLMAAVRSHKRRQNEERLAFGEGYQNLGNVFCREDGSPIHPETISTAFEWATKRAKLKKIRFHDCRHSAATIALTIGIPAKVVAEWLGHNSVKTTLDVYSHVMPSMDEEAGQRLTSSILN